MKEKRKCVECGKPVDRCTTAKYCSSCLWKTRDKERARQKVYSADPAVKKHRTAYNREYNKRHKKDDGIYVFSGEEHRLMI